MDRNLPLASRVAYRALTPSRVVARYVSARGWEGKHVGKDARLQWSRDTWLLEELPQKGKKKLKSATLQNPSGFGHLDWWIPGNILMLAKLTGSDDYSAIKKKISAAYDEAFEKSKAETDPRRKEWFEKSQWVKDLKWYEDDVFYLKVIPEGTEEFTAEGKDFKMAVGWLTFSAYSPSSDFQQAQPYYSGVQAKSPTAARKLYLMLKQNPKTLKTVSYYELGDWLNKQKIPWRSSNSVWT